jgi:subtilase family serine protease
LSKLLVAAPLAAVALIAAVAAGAANIHTNYHAVCPGAANETARCHAQVMADERGNPAVSPTPSPTALTPADFRTAYKLTGTGSPAQTIAIVDAYDYPTAEADLARFSSQYGLPSCTTANGCFRKVNQTGGTNVKRYRTDAGWALEAALDLQTAHGICPSCKILFVEGQTASISNLATAVNTAASLGATVISNSYGAPDSTSLAGYNASYNHPGVAITVSTGDNGYQVQWPASAPYVTAVGGTTLTKDGSARGFRETAWNGAGSGCSVQTKPTWQTSVTGCARKANSDVAADADPNTGASIYDSTPYNGGSGWYQVGGTSLAAPLVAGVYGLAGNASGTSYPVTYAWSNPGALFDITSGSNGSCPTPVWCTAGIGWDGPTGLGTPNGLGAF